MMIQIWGEGNSWVNELIKLFLLDDLKDLQVRQGESVNKFIDRMDSKFLGASLAGVGISERVMYRQMSQKARNWVRRKC